MTRLLIDYWPPAIREIADFAVLAHSQQPEFNLSYSQLDTLLDNLLLLTAGELGISRWEALLEIDPPSTATLEERRFTVLARLGESLPFTLRRLQSILDNLLGVGNSVASTSDYILKILLGTNLINQMGAVRALCERIVPANMVIQIVIRYNTHGELQPFTHAILGHLIHEQVRSEDPDDFEEVASANNP